MMEKWTTPDAWVWTVETHDGQNFRELGKIVLTRKYFEKEKAKITNKVARFKFLPRVLAKKKAEEIWDENPLILREVDVIECTGIGVLKQLIAYLELVEDNSSLEFHDIGWGVIYGSKS